MQNILAKLGLLFFLIAFSGSASAQRAFEAFGIGTASVTATTASAATALTIPTQSGAVPRKMQVRVYNAGGATVFVLFGTSGATATTGNMPVPSGAVEVFSVPEGTTHAATITSSGTGTIYFTTGLGE